MKRSLVLFLIVGLICIAFTGCSSGETDSEGDSDVVEMNYISLATGSVSGVYYPLGGAFASIINNNIEGANCSVESTGGSIANILLVHDKEAELAFADASSTYNAIQGKGAFEGNKIDDVRGILSTYPEAVQIVSTNPEINSITDLKGKKVAVGAVGSGTETMAKLIFELYGMSYDDITVDFLGFSDASAGLKDKTIDAAFIWAGVPTSGIMDLGAQHEITMIDFKADEMKRLIQVSPYCIPMSIDKSIYSSLTSDVTTIAIPALIIGHKDLPEEFVYNFLVETFENIEVLQKHMPGVLILR